MLARVGLGAPAPAAAPSLDRALVYASLVEPVLQAHCVSCHGAARAEGGLRLDSPEALMKGGENGPVVAPGRADRSEIVRRLWLPASHADAMPPSGQRPLAPAEAALVRWWIDRGARFDAEGGRRRDVAGGVARDRSGLRSAGARRSDVAARDAAAARSGGAREAHGARRLGRTGRGRHAVPARAHHQRAAHVRRCGGQAGGADRGARAVARRESTRGSPTRGWRRWRS